MNQKMVVALGGNALGNDVEGQKIALKNTARVVVDLYEKGVKLIITHGNGPQVGMIQQAMNHFTQDVSCDKIPLSTCVAMSQGYIGFDLQNSIKNELAVRKIDAKVSTILSQVEVYKEDEAFCNPKKPIGTVVSEEEMKKDSAHSYIKVEQGYRKVVASPQPRRIRELKTIQTLMDAGHIVITCGGGGIPVIDCNGTLEGVDAVIDKDSVSCLLARELEADYFAILTAVEKVAINYKTENEQWLSLLTVKQAREYINENQFEAGSMLPKVQAAIDFVEDMDNRCALITSLDKLAEGLDGTTGTIIRR